MGAFKVTALSISSKKRWQNSGAQYWMCQASFSKTLGCTSLYRSNQTLSVTLLGEVLIQHLNPSSLGGGDREGKDSLMCIKLSLFKEYLRQRTKLIRMKLAWRSFSQDSRPQLVLSTCMISTVTVFQHYTTSLSNYSQNREAGRCLLSPFNWYTSAECRH